jgi:hypothetical protein
MTKTCTKCGVEKPFSEFNKDKRNNKDKCNKKTGLRSQCKICQKQYRQNNKEKITEIARQWQQNNKEKVAEYHRRYCQNNKEKVAEQKRKYQQNNKEKVAEYHRRYCQNNKEKVAEQKRKYQQKNKEKIAERLRQYRQDNKEKITEQRKKWIQKPVVEEAQKKYKAQWYQDNIKTLPAGIYKITNKKTGVVYIGCSTTIPIRWRRHKNDLKKNKHNNKLLQETYNQCGLEGFKFEVIKEYPPDTPFEVLEREETKLILEHKTKGIPMYNMSIRINSIDENHLTL